MNMITVKTFFITVFCGGVLLMAAWTYSLMQEDYLDIPEEINYPQAMEGDNVTEAIPAMDGGEVSMIVTAYCPGECCCGEFADGLTASGKPAVGFLVAAPPEYPFGTLMAISGYAGGEKVPVEDRGGAIKGNWLDVFFPTHQEALNWGRQKLNVKVYRSE
jgi:3D (Asp-Asp-Asp) domain-containing protein